MLKVEAQADPSAGQCADDAFSMRNRASIVFGDTRAAIAANAERSEIQVGMPGIGNCKSQESTSQNGLVALLGGAKAGDALRHRGREVNAQDVESGIRPDWARDKI